MEGLRVVERERTACDFKADAVAGREDAGGGFESESPLVDFVCGIAGAAKEMRRAGDADADKLGAPLCGKADELASEVGAGR